MLDVSKKAIRLHHLVTEVMVMSNDLIDEDTYTNAITPFDFNGQGMEPGGHEWARRLVERYVEVQSNRRRNDGHLGRMVQQVRSYLQNNQPVMAYQWIEAIKELLVKRGDI